MAFFDKLRNRAPQELDPTKVLSTIMEVLIEEGYRPERDVPFRVHFKCEGYFFAFFYLEEDPEFLHLRTAFDKEIFRDVPEHVLLRACLHTIEDQKVSKVFVDKDGDVCFTAESFLFAGVPLGHLAKRLIQALTVSIGFFMHKVGEYERIAREQQEESTPLFPPGFSSSSDLPN